LTSKTLGATTCGDFVMVVAPLALHCVQILQFHDFFQICSLRTCTPVLGNFI
jgi:hypothetical protein